MTQLAPMTPADFDEFLADSITGYAQDKIASGQWAANEADALSAKEFHADLPQGLHTPDNYLYRIEDETGHKVGSLWFAAKDRGGQRVAYVNDVSVLPAHQRQGHAERAFGVLEAEVKRLGLEGIALHVFGHNKGARALYAKLGFVTTNINMFKPTA